MNTITRLIQVVDTMETGATPELVSEFSGLLSQVGSRHNDNPAAKKLVNLIFTSAQYLGIEDPHTHNQIQNALQTMCRGLLDISQDPGMASDASGQTFSECLSAYTGLKELLDAQPLISMDDMEELKAIILSVDWEISDETLERFDQITTTLMARFRFHKVFYPFLKIINSMGRYIASKKEAAHKDSVTFLQTVFEHFEQVALNAYMPFREKKALIEKDIAAFNDFKKKAAAAESEPVAEPTAVLEPAAEPVHEPEPVSQPEPEEAIRPALSHVKAPKIREQHTLTALGDIPEVSSQAAYAAAAENSESGGVASLPEEGGRDVMGDLFNPKENEADRLMDQIHMSMVPGGPGAAPSLTQDNPEGFENLVPKRMDNVPTPEISNRLDNFFNLDPVAPSRAPEPDTVIAHEVEAPASAAWEELAIDEPPVKVLEEEVSVVTMLEEAEPEEEAFEEEVPEEDEFDGETALFEVEEEQQPAQLILFEADDTANENRPDTAPVVEKLTLFAPDEDPVQKSMEGLNAFMDATASAADLGALSQAGENLSLLKSVWQNDPERSLLVNLASHLLNRIQDGEHSGGSEEETAIESDSDLQPETVEALPEEAQDSPKPRKFWPFGRSKRNRAK